MKTTKNFLFLLITLVFSGCASTETASAVHNDKTKNQPEDIAGDDQTESTTSGTTKSLIDSYISGDLPGYGD